MSVAETPGARAEIVEVGPRDGLQNESVHFDTARKRDFILRLLDAGLRRMEVASFVNPKRVPQMADAEALLESLPQDRGARYVGLVLNPRGVERALRTAVHELNFVIVASDTFNRKNQGVSTADSLAVWFEIARLAQEAKVPCGLTLAAAFGCPYEGEVPLSQLVELAQRAAAADPAEIALADTIGVAVPAEVTRRIGAVRGAVGDTPLRCHFHNTRNTGLANAWAAWQAGVRVLDASAGGIGGCPTGEARLSAGHRLPARYVIHTVGPVWQGGAHGEPELLAACYQNCLRLAAEHALRHIAFPAISCGVYGYPPAQAAAIAVQTCRAHATPDMQITFACFDAKMLSLYHQQLRRHALGS